MRISDIRLINIDENIFKVSQLYADINDEKDIHVNGSVSLIGDVGKITSIKIMANLCDAKGAILMNMNSYKSHKTEVSEYFVFNLYCADVSRYFDVNELEHIELYAEYNTETD